MLDPVFQRLVDQWLDIVGRDKVRITSGYRSPREQDDLYAQGRTKNGAIVTNARGTPVAQSSHCFGVAIDFVPIVNGVPKYDRVLMNEYAQIAKQLGMTWGGDWFLFPDAPHLEYLQGQPLSYFQNGGKLTQEPVTNISPQQRVANLYRRMERCLSSESRSILSHVIERLKKRF